MCFLSQMDRRHQNQQGQIRGDEIQDLQQQSLLFQNWRQDHEQQQQQLLIADTERLLALWQQAQNIRLQAWRQHVPQLVTCQEHLQLLAPGTQFSAGTLTLFKFCENCICKLYASRFNVTSFRLFQIYRYPQLKQKYRYLTSASNTGKN